MAISRGVNSFSARHGLQLALEALEKSASCLIPSSSATNYIVTITVTPDYQYRNKASPTAESCALLLPQTPWQMPYVLAMSGVNLSAASTTTAWWHSSISVSTLPSRFSVHPLSLPSYHFGSFFARSLSQHAPVNMRYEDWDILLFPQGCEVPMKEFKVACHVVHDPGEPNPQSYCARRQSLITRSN